MIMLAYGKPGAEGGGLALLAAGPKSRHRSPKAKG
jgi:hypothetical protein